MSAQTTAAPAEEMTHGLTPEAEGAMASRALALYVDFWQSRGSETAYLDPFKQAWLNVRARLDGRPAPLLADALAEKPEMTPLERVCVANVLPAWVPESERLRWVRRTLADRVARGEPLPTPEQAKDWTWGF